MLGAVQTGCFVMAAVGAFYVLAGRDLAYGRTFLRVGGDRWVRCRRPPTVSHRRRARRMVAQNQPVTLAAMEGLFQSERNAPLVILGQPDVERQHIDNPLVVPGALSFLTYRAWSARVRGLDQFPAADWPDRIPLLYYSYHVMVGLGTIFIAILCVAAWKLWRGTLYTSRAVLWLLLLACAVSLHRQHCRLDHRRSGASAVADLRPAAHRRGRVAAGLRRKRVVHFPGLCRHVCGPGHSVSLPCLRRDSSGPDVADAQRAHPAPREVA